MFGDCGGLLGVNELLNFRTLLVDLSQMLCSKLLINIKFLLCLILLSYVNIVRSQAIMRIGQVWVQFQRAQVLRDRFRILMLVGV